MRTGALFKKFDTKLSIAAPYDLAHKLALPTVRKWQRDRNYFIYRRRFRGPDTQAEPAEIF